MNERFIVIMGPTGVGKSDLVLNLGKAFDIEIVNGDIGSFYEPCTIGTAKPDWKNSLIPHHLFDVITEPRDCTVMEYRKLVLDQFALTWHEKKIPVLVGGSGFYLKSIFFPPQEIIFTDDISNSPVEGSWQDLYSRDPERAEALDKNDFYRINRALSLIQKTGKKASDFKPFYNPPKGRALIVFLTRDRQELYHRIDDRVNLMIKQGWIDEIATLIQNGWTSFLERKKLIGYNDLVEYLNNSKKNDASLMKKMIETIQQKSRHYAKRQLTFWRSFNKILQPFINSEKLLINEINLSHKNGSKDFMHSVEKFLTD